jgi:hypothetical protein
MTPQALNRHEAQFVRPNAGHCHGDSTCGCPRCLANAMASESVREIVRELHLSGGYLLHDRI